MQKISVLLCAVLSFSSFLLAEEVVTASPRNMDLTINPFRLAIGEIPVRFSFGLGSKVALGVTVAGRYSTVNKQVMKGFGGGLDAKFYLSGPAYTDSWYLKPGVQVSYLSLSSVSKPYFGGFATAGYSWVWSGGFTLDIGLGAEFSHTKITSDESSFGLTGIWPTADFSLGFAF